MDFKAIFMDNIEYLTEYTSNLDVLLICLLGKHILDNDECERVKHEPTMKNKLFKLYSILAAKPYCLDNLLVILEANQNPNVAAKLREEMKKRENSNCSKTVPEKELKTVPEKELKTGIPLNSKITQENASWLKDILKEIDGAQMKVFLDRLFQNKTHVVNDVISSSLHNGSISHSMLAHKAFDKWIEIEGKNATYGNLIVLLREDTLNNAADKIENRCQSGS